jgi:hypothetical protein
MVSVENLFLLVGNELNIILIIYPILGAGIKYIDSAYDNNTFNKKIAIFIAPFLGGLWAFAMIITTWSGIILLAVLLGVFIKGKIDNRAHIIGFLIIFFLLLFFGKIPPMVPLIFLSAAAVLDEVGHDIIGYKLKYFQDYHFRHQFSLYFFGRRYLMKVAIIFLVLIGLFPLESFLAFLFFDEAYIIFSLYSKSREKIKANNDKIQFNVQ